MHLHLRVVCESEIKYVYKNNWIARHCVGTMTVHTVVGDRIMRCRPDWWKWEPTNSFLSIFTMCSIRCCRHDVREWKQLRSTRLLWFTLWSTDPTTETAYSIQWVYLLGCMEFPNSYDHMALSGGGFLGIFFLFFFFVSLQRAPNLWVCRINFNNSIPSKYNEIPWKSVAPVSCEKRFSFSPEINHDLNLELQTNISLHIPHSRCRPPSKFHAAWMPQHGECKASILGSSHRFYYDK